MANACRNDDLPELFSLMRQPNSERGIFTSLSALEFVTDSCVSRIYVYVFDDAMVESLLGATL